MDLLKELNQIVLKFQGLILDITVDDIRNKVVARLNPTIKTVDNYKDSVVQSIKEVIKKGGAKYSSYKVCTIKDKI